MASASSSTSQLTRRLLLRSIGLSASALLLAACGGVVPASPTAPPPTSPSPTPATNTPSPTATAVTAASTSAPAAAPATSTPLNASQASSKPGRELIGRLEGPTVVTDSVQIPKQFQEAPQLAALVEQGTLPPVAERVGQDPLVIKPVHEIGVYGGTWHRGFAGPGDQGNGWRVATGPDRLLFMDYTGNRIVPNIAHGIQQQDGGRTWLVQLRKGMRWSDGQPFTADDVLFWFEDLYSDPTLRPTPSSTMTINGKPGKVDKIDETTVRFVFPDPYYMFPDVLAGSTPLAGHAWQGSTLMGAFAPAHYLKQFLPRYTSQDAVDKLAHDAGYDNWVTFLKFKNDWTLNTEVPTVAPWRTVQPINTATWLLERNPYSIWVDTAGNQLPYLDQISMQLGETLEVINLRAIAGQYDWQERHIDIGKLPVLLENKDKGNYTVHLDPGEWGADMAIKFNLSYEADPEIARWFNTTDFRRALSLGIDRDQLNETFWLGLGTAGSMVPADTNKYNPGPEYRTRWATHDPAQANMLLDRVGLDKKDDQGFRLRTDGGGRLRIEITTVGGQLIQFTQIAEVIKEQWTRIGIELLVQERERSLAERTATANLTQLYPWLADGNDHLFTFPDHVFPFNETSANGPLYGQWFQSNGRLGKEPPVKVREIMDAFRKAFGVPEQERIALGKQIWATVADEVFVIGTVGLSPAGQGIRVVKNTMGNVPDRLFNSPDGMNPCIIHPASLFIKA